MKNPQDVLPPALGASMYTIACILSYDGLPAVVRSKDLSPNQAWNQNSAEASTFSQVRGVSYSPPGSFLMSLLLADKPHNATVFQKSSNHPGGVSGQSQRPFRSSRGQTAFERRRDAL